jgi:hypothetical protein
VKDNLRELLTAAIDGELSPTDQKLAQRLLQKSESARIMLSQLKSDSKRLRKLPRVSAPADLAENVLAVIAERSMTPTPLPPGKRPSPKFNWSMLPVWVNLVTAAGVLFVISAGSYLYFTASERYYESRAQGMASKGPNSKTADPGSATPVVDAKLPETKGITPEIGPEPKMVVQGPRDPGPEIGPSPRQVPDIILAPPEDGMPEIEAFHLDKIRVSHLVTLRDLPDDEAARKKLTAEMKKDELIRLDLFCHSTPNGLELTLASLKARGITVFTDAFAQDRLKRKLPTELMLFTEAMTPEEVAQLLAELGSVDAKSGAGEFDTLVAAPFLSLDLDRLGKLLGVSSIAPKPAVGKAPIDVRKPLPEGTANHLAATLAKMGTTSTPPKTEKVAVVVAYSPMNGQPTNSREIKQFLDRRGDRKPDAKPLMLVLKTISK